MGYGTSLVLGLNRTAMTLPAAYSPLPEDWCGVTSCRHAGARAVGQPLRNHASPPIRALAGPDDEFGRLVDITREMSEP
jgi:hypothetical protein